MTTNTQKKYEEGCGSKLNYEGDCMYISPQGNKKYCPKCSYNGIKQICLSF